MSDTPKFLVLQSESTLLTFAKNSELPFPLYTTNVCNCLCIILYSPSQGVAYLGHLDLDNMDRNDFEKYTAYFDQLIQTHGLNSGNTEIALIGANNTEVTPHFIGFDDSTGVLHFKAYFEKTFRSITEIIGRKKSLERNIELTSEALRVMEVEFLHEQRILNYKEIALNSSEWPNNKRLFTLEHSIEGELMDQWSAERISKINFALGNKAFFQRLNMLLNENIPKRSFIIGMTEAETLELAGMSVGNLLPLVSITQNSRVSKALFYCAVLNPELLAFLLAEIPWDRLKDFSYHQINCFRFAAVRRDIRAKTLSLEQALASDELGSNSSKPFRPSIDTSGQDIQNLPLLNSPKEQTSCVIS